MSIDGARSIDEVDTDAWSRLAAEIGVRKSFAQSTAAELTVRVLAEADVLRESDGHDNDTAAEIVKGIFARSAG